MKQFIVLVSLVLLSLSPISDNHRGEPYKSQSDKKHDLSSKDYQPPVFNLNETPKIIQTGIGTGNSEIQNFLFIILCSFRS